jgi:thiamine-phosphate pyrophosphorylase
LALNLPRIYPITDTQISGLSQVDQARRLIDGGAKIIQLREKRAGWREFFEAAVEVMQLAKVSGTCVIINDRADIAIAVSADGVHLGQDDMPPEKARQLLGDHAIIGYSTHTVAQALAAAKLPVDYIAIGPIFETNSKEDTGRTVGLEGIRAVREAIGDRPLVAIGGIVEADLASVFAAGADSAAMISSIVANADSITQTMLHLTDRYA